VPQALARPDNSSRPDIETCDCCETADGDGIAGNVAAGLGAEKDGGKTGGLQRIVLRHLDRVARPVAHAAAHTRHL
jgi:hypothetical protein